VITVSWALSQPIGWLVVFAIAFRPAATVLIGDRSAPPIRQRLGGNDPQLCCRVDPRRRHRAQMEPAIPEVELVKELLAQGQRAEPGAVAIDESLIEVIEFGLTYPSAVGEHELMQMRAIPAREGGINRIGKLSEAVGTGRREHPPRPWPVILAAAAHQIDPNR